MQEPNEKVAASMGRMPGQRSPGVFMMQSVKVRDRLHTNLYAIFFLLMALPASSMPVTSPRPISAKIAAER